MSQRPVRMSVAQHRGEEAKQEMNKEQVNECNFKEKKNRFMSRAEHEERFLTEPSRGRNYGLIQVDGHETTTARRWRGSQTSEGPAERRQDGGGGSEERQTERKSRTGRKEHAVFMLI